MKQTQAERVQLQQSYVRLGKQAMLQQSRCEHAKPFNRSRLRNARCAPPWGVTREVERKTVDSSSESGGCWR